VTGIDGPVLVTGGTGTLGRPLVERLAGAGAGVRVMSRRSRPAGRDLPYEWAVADFGKNQGLDAAVAGAGAVVHCATSPRSDAEYARRLVQAVRRSAGGVSPHLVYISIVGIDDVPFMYYRAKLEAERIVESSGLPWTILRATQFHDLIAKITGGQRRLPFVLAPSGVRFQPVEVTEVAERLADLARGEPAGRVPDMGGPEVRTGRELAETTMSVAGWRRRIVPLRLPGKAGQAVRDGALLTPRDRAVGTVTFETYLRKQAEAAGR
jgi:uncharacterized protein YbjT (DUF2867 family)